MPKKECKVLKSKRQKSLKEMRKSIKTKKQPSIPDEHHFNESINLKCPRQLESDIDKENISP